MGEVLKFVTPIGGLRKKTQSNFCVFRINNLILNLFRLNFGLKDLF